LRGRETDKQKRRKIGGRKKRKKDRKGKKK
jgi:hypothetical protein